MLLCCVRLAVCRLLPVYCGHSSRIRFLRFFFENPKNATFYVFLADRTNGRAYATVLRLSVVVCL